MLTLNSNNHLFEYLMKSYFKYILSATAAAMLAGCDNGFEQLNKNPVVATSEQFKPQYLFSTAQYRTFKGEESTSLYYATTFCQQMASLSDRGIFDFFGDKYVYHQSENDVLWNATFEGSVGPVKQLEAMFFMTNGAEEYHNLIQMGRIWRTIVYHRLTDMYGDVPYSEAGKGATEKIYKPKYDTQKDIYYHMLSELEDATDKLDASKNNFAAADIAYKGDIQKWKKLGYSMMLRLGMRLSKVEPDVAKTWVDKAFKGGTLGSNADNLIIRGTDATGANPNLTNGQSSMFRVSFVPGRISATFFNYLKNTGDPRLKYIPAIYTDWRDNTSIKTDPAIQKGLPNGLNRTTMEKDPSYDPALGSELQYSGINRNIFAKLDGPRMFLTYAESQLLLAEAAIRGWISADAKSLYESGVAAAMRIYLEYDASANITETDIQAYLTANPFVGIGDTEKAFEQINTQYWIATFLNGYETYANVRRSGYPKLIPVNYKTAGGASDNDTDGKFPRRLRYPWQAEIALNKENYDAAVARMGGNDDMVTRVWWDKE